MAREQSPALPAAASAGRSHTSCSTIKAMLFADVEGFSKLDAVRHHNLLRNVVAAI